MKIKARIERAVIASMFCACAGIVMYVGIRGLSLPLLAAAPLVVLFSLAATFWLFPRLPAALDGMRNRRPWLSVAWLFLALMAIVQTARLSAFMLDPTQFQHSLLPDDPWMVAHCCLTAYSESARLTSDGEKNIYKETHYRGPDSLFDKGIRRKLESFTVDPYHYPPPFLLLPLTVRAATGDDFLSVRMVWFGMSALALLLAMGLVAWRLEPEGQLRAIGIAPLIWCSMPVLSGLQMSNAQILVVSISVIAIVCFKRQTALGGLLLAMSTVAKIFPGVLFVYLLARRNWREVGWTAGFALVFTVVALLAVGSTPYQAFIGYELPRLSSGEAFSRPFSAMFAVARNMSPFGIPLKLGWLGIPGMTLEVGRIVSMIYLLGVVGLAIWSGRRQPRSNTEAVSVWLSLLSLGTLASPFAPANYVLVSLVWLVCINRELFRPVIMIVVWVLISAPFLISRDAPFLLQAICYFPAQALAIGVPVVILWSAGVERAFEADTKVAIDRATA